MNDLKTARALGWMSMGIAAAEILGRGWVERKLLGIHEHRQLMLGLGIREATAGATILSQRKVTATLAAGLWSRVGGDAMDLALLATAAPRSRRRLSLGANTLLVLGVTALDVCCAWRVQRHLLQRKAYLENSGTHSPPRIFASHAPEHIPSYSGDQK
jgi:hypothetical protein